MGLGELFVYGGYSIDYIVKMANMEKIILRGFMLKGFSVDSLALLCGTIFDAY